MERPGRQQAIQVVRGLLGLRLFLVLPFLLIAAVLSCTPGLTATIILFLLAMAGLPALGYFLRRDLLMQPQTQGAIALGDFLLITLLNTLCLYSHESPYFFPLYILVVVEAACWWGWPGSLVSGTLGGITLYLQYTKTSGLRGGLWLIVIIVTAGWSVVLGYFTRRILGNLWRTTDRLALHEDALRRSRGQLLGWQTIWEALNQKESLSLLLNAALCYAVDGTRSSLGLITLRDDDRDTCRVESWSGFALSGPGKTTLEVSERVPSMENGELIEVRHVLKAPLTMATAETDEQRLLGWIVVARGSDRPYHEHEVQWLHLLASYAAVLVENRFLQGQLGRFRKESDGIAQAGWTLTSLPNPTAALEMACRRVQTTLGLHQVMLFLYRGAERSGCRMIVYLADAPARTTMMSLRGRGLNLLRRFLDSGAPLIANRRSECPEIFEAMEWGEEVQAVACFPLVALHRRWGALCLLAGMPGAFSPQVQQSLDTFSGEIAMALENFYLRRLIAESSGDAAIGRVQPNPV